MEKIIITGGLGFIGSHLAEELCKKYDVHIVDISDKFSNVENFKEKITIHSVSILNKRELEEIFKNSFAVLHHAALISVIESIENPQLYYRVNVEGTRNVLEASVKCKVERVIIASSAAVYGNLQPPLKENLKPKPLSPYAETKLINERDSYFFFKKKGLNTICLRYFNVFGPRQDESSNYAGVITKFISSFKNFKTPTIFGNGLQTRDFIYVKDVVNANLKALIASEDAFGKTFNISTGKPITIISLLELVAKILGEEPRFVQLPPRKGEILHSWADTSLAEKMLNFRASYTLEEGLKETIFYQHLNHKL